MTISKIFLPALAATACLTGCVYEEATYEQPHRVYHGGYAPREVVVVERGPAYYNRPHTYPYYDGRSRGYYQQPPARTYYNRPYASGVYVAPGHRGESWEERQRRELREAQRTHEKKDDDKKKKKKKKDHDD